IYLTSCHLLFFCNDPATTEIYTLSLHDALPISRHEFGDDERTSADRAARIVGPARVLTLEDVPGKQRVEARRVRRVGLPIADDRSEEHTSELQSPCNLVCRLLLEKKKKQQNTYI